MDRLVCNITPYGRPAAATDTPEEQRKKLLKDIEDLICTIPQIEKLPPHCCLPRKLVELPSCSISAILTLKPILDAPKTDKPDPQLWNPLIEKELPR
jgi:hypothetical protein